MTNRANEQKSNVNRREFINHSGKVVAVAGAAVLAGPSINVLGANEVLQLGIVGSGKRGRYLMTQAMTMSTRKSKALEFVAVADSFDGWREEGAATGERVANETRQYKSHKEMLEKEKLDGIVVGTPEHTHFEIAMDIVNAGVAQYLEKPMVHTIDEAKKLVAAVKAKKAVLQVGTQRRSVPLFYQARDIIKGGKIGPVTFVEGWWNRNFKNDDPHAAWNYEIPEDASAETCDWKAFLGPAPERPFDKKRYFQWRCYWDYSNGIGSDLMVHQIDAINAVMESGIPTSVVASGGIYRWKDGRETPDVWSALMEFEEGYQINYHARFNNTTNNNKQYGVAFYGTDGTINIDLHHQLYVTPEESWLANIEVDPVEAQYGNGVGDATDGAVRDHIENWVDAITSGGKLNCDAEAGFHASVISSMSVMSYHTGKKVMWNKEKQEAYTA